MRFVFVVLPVFALLSACTTSPTSGQQIFTGLVSEQQENQVGSTEHADILKQYNGVSDNAKLNEFVAMVGARLVPTAERQGLTWHFTVLNSDIVNAFAVPGGYIYITRGLLNLAQDESQVASVLAHEMGHINARHSAQQMSQGMIANIGLQALSVATGSDLASQLGGVGAQAFMMKYSREHEYEADALSVKYLTAAGYDPYATMKFLMLLNESTALESRMAGNTEGASYNLMSSHPMTPDRVSRARALADAATKIKYPTINRGKYLRAIDGTVYGDAAQAGFTRGNEFIHPVLQIRFTVPAGFKINNGSKQVVADNGQGAAIIFDMGKGPTNDAADYMTGTWASGAPLNAQERIEVNGMAGATASTSVSTSKGQKDAQLVALNGGGGQFYRLTFLTPPGQLANYSTAFRTATYSFTHDTAIGQVSPNRVRLITVKEGDTPQSLAAKMPVQDYAIERFCLLNNISPTDRLTPGDLIKTVE